MIRKWVNQVIVGANSCSTTWVMVDGVLINASNGMDSRSHSATMWTKSYPILTTHPSRVENCGNFMYFLPFQRAKHGVSTDHYLPTSSGWRSYWMTPRMVVVWGLHHLVIWVFVECRQESKPQQHMCAISSSILHSGWKGYQNLRNV